VIPDVDSRGTVLTTKTARRPGHATGSAVGLCGHGTELRQPSSGAPAARQPTSDRRARRCHSRRVGQQAGAGRPIGKGLGILMFLALSWWTSSIHVPGTRRAARIARVRLQSRRALILGWASRPSRSRRSDLLPMIASASRRQGRRFKGARHRSPRGLPSLPRILGAFPITKRAHESGTRCGRAHLRVVNVGLVAGAVAVRAGIAYRETLASIRATPAPALAIMAFLAALDGRTSGRFKPRPDRPARRHDVRAGALQRKRARSRLAMKGTRTRTTSRGGDRQPPRLPDCDPETTSRGEAFRRGVFAGEW